MTDLLRFNRQAAGGDLSSSDLLRLCGERLTDAALWKEFQSRFHKTILTFVMRVMCNAFRNDCLEEACDIAQEVYLRMLDNNGRMLRSFKGDTDFSVKAFLSRVAVNVVSDHHRRTTAEKRQPAEIISIEDAREQGRDLKGEAAELDIASILSWIDVERLMDSESDRRNAARNVLIFKLHHVDGFSVQEIAGFPVFGLKETAIRDALNQMRAHLKEVWGNDTSDHGRFRSRPRLTFAGDQGGVDDRRRSQAHLAPGYDRRIGSVLLSRSPKPPDQRHWSRLPWGTGSASRGSGPHSPRERHSQQPAHERHDRGHAGFRT